MLKNIFGRFWAAWALITFIITFIIIFLPSMGAHLYKDYLKGQDYFIKVSKVWMSFWLFIVGCPVRVYGKENFKAGENYVVTYNHNAFLDVPLSAPFLPGPNKTIAKASFAKVPIFAEFYKRGSVLVDRKADNSRVKSFEEMKEVLRQGMHMCIYPEGTRNRTGKPLKPFYDGAFKLAIASGKNIIPAVISGTSHAMPVNKKFFLFPTPLQLHFLPQVSSTGKRSEELKNEVYAIMENKFLELEKNFKN